MQPTPIITGFSPPSATIGLFENPISTTILGSGFADYDTVEIRGLTVPSSFLDSSHIQATIPYQFTGATGSLPFSVVSPYTGSSNTLSLQLVNPVATIHYILPATLGTGSPNTNVFLYGVNFVSGSVVQWNGQNLATTPNGGETSAGDELLSFAVPANLLANTGTATIRVFNPGPAGGISDPISFDVSPAHPVVNYPASIDFGTILLGTTVTQTILLRNNGSGNYTASSVTIGSPYSVLSNTCTNVTFVVPGNFCNVQLQFSPVAAGSTNTTLTVTDNGSASPLHIPVTGAGSQMIVPVVTVFSVDSLGRTNSVTLTGTATVGGLGVSGTAWLEYGTDPVLNTFVKSPSWSFTGDNAPLSGSVTGLTPATSYAIRLVVQTAGGTGKSNIRLFTTLPARHSFRWNLRQGAQAR
jgi:HYDIN/CFA65/VesB family protein